MASRRAQRRRRCLGKRKYETAAAAWRDVADMRRKQRRNDIDAYHCLHCGGIHVGHTPKRRASWPTLKRGAR
jgi:hypothetical protein